MKNRKLIITVILSILLFSGFVITYFFFPKLEFQSPKLNRIFGICLNIFCICLPIVIFGQLKEIRNKIIKFFIGLLNGIFIFIAVINFPIYLMKIDPQIQYYDIETLYWNRENKFQKIQKQYYINWKSNKKIVITNKVFDFGPFRNFIEYNVQIDKLSENWVKTEKKKE